MASIGLSESSGYVGDNVTVSGTGFTSGDTISAFTFDGVQPVTQTCIGQIVALDGTWSGTFTVPVHVAGMVTVEATDTDDGPIDTSFTVDSAIVLGSGGLGKVGDTITVTGTGFIGSHALTATLGATAITLLPTSVSDGTGSYSGHFVVPAKASDGNPYTFTVTDGTNPATANFSIVAAISLAPASGHVGASSTVTGSGFIYAGGFQPITTLTFDSIDILNHGSPPVVAIDGSWSQGFTVPTDSKGYKTVVADDASGEGAPSANYLVAPAISVSPTDATVGTVGVTVVGTGFTASTAISTFTFDGATPGTQTVTAQTTDLTGGFTGTFTVPAHANGSVTLIVADAVPDSASTTFTVDAKITVTPTHGTVGTAGITVTGSGYTATDAIATFTVSGLTPTTNTCVGQVVAVDGSWSGTFTLDALPGSGNTITATTADDTANFTFTVDAAISLTPSTGHVGLTGVSVTGTGFQNGIITGITFYNGSSAVIPTHSAFPTPVNGGFTMTFTIPHAAAGAEAVTVYNALSTASTNFTVTPLMTFLPSATGTVGTTVTVTGTGFTGSDTITAFTFDGVQPAHQTCIGVVITATGDWTGALIVPAHARATVIVEATDAMDIIDAFYTVIPKIILSPTSGLEGIIVTVTGSGFTNPSTINTLTIGGIVPADDTCIGQIVAADGSWTGTFRVPPLPSGAQTVAISSNAVPPDSVTASFNESTTVVGTEMVTEDVLDNNGDVMWTVTHALSSVKLATAPAFQDEKVVAYDNSARATDTESMQVEETSDATSPGSKTTKKIVVQHNT